MFVKAASLVLLFVAYSTCSPNSDFNPGVVSGAVATNGQFPYQVSVQRASTHVCGGSILDETTILTAAHCVKGQLPKFMSVVVGMHSLKLGGKTHYIAEMSAHLQYVPDTIHNDIALIKLIDPIQFTTKIKPVKLPTRDTGAAEEVTLSGWGNISYPGIVSDKLQYIKLRTIDLNRCKREQTLRMIYTTQVCTFAKEGEVACHGDSGGPLVNGEGEQVGIVSWGDPCARGTPDVFTRVHSFLDWIEFYRKFMLRRVHISDL